MSDYLGVIARRKWIVLLVTVLATVGAVAYSKSQTPKYAATAQLLASPQALSQASKSSVSWSEQNQPLAANVHVANLVVGAPGSKPSLPSIPAAENVAINGPTFAPFTKSGLTGIQLFDSTTITASTAPDSIVFTVTNPDPLYAEQLATAWANAYGYLYQFNQVKTTVGKYVAEDRLLNPTLYGLPATTLSAADKAKYTSDLQGLRGQLASPPTTLSIQPADTSTQTQPQTSRNIVIGVVLGLVFGVLLAFVQDLLDKRIRTTDEIGRRLRVPLLASIPMPPRSLREHKLVMLAPRGGPQAPSAEAYRIAKLNLATVIRPRKAKVIMFVSAAEHEGTSTMSANLAVVLARAGMHVALIDANMRRPAIDGYFGLDDRIGLSDILAGNGDLADALTIVDVANEQPATAVGNGHMAATGLLEVLPAGPTPSDPADLLDSRTMTDLLVELRSRADIVLIDAPPMLPVTDAMVLGGRVDGVIVVARSRLASRPHMVALARALDACAAPALGFIFTGTSVAEENEYGGYVGVSGVEPQSPSRAAGRERELL